MKYLLVDTGVWYAVFDDRDEHYRSARHMAEYLDRMPIVLPWPILYETLWTGFVKNGRALRLFENRLKRPGISYLDDSAYRDAAFRLSLDSSLRRARPLSLVDCAIRLVLEDVNVKIGFLATYNPRDFVDVCAGRRIEMV